MNLRIHPDTMVSDEDVAAFQRDGAIDRQRKIHVTPAEARWWGVEPGNEVRVFDTDRGKVAIATPSAVVGLRGGVPGNGIG